MGFRSFHKGNMGSSVQRAAKLLAVKVGVLQKKSTASAITTKVCASTSTLVQVRLGSNHSQSSTDSNFTALLPNDFILPVWKDLNPPSKYYVKSSGLQQHQNGICMLKVTSFSQGLFSNRLIVKGQNRVYTAIPVRNGTITI